MIPLANMTSELLLSLHKITWCTCCLVLYCTCMTSHCCCCRWRRRRCCSQRLRSTARGSRTSAPPATPPTSASTPGTPPASVRIRHLSRYIHVRHLSRYARHPCEHLALHLPWYACGLCQHVLLPWTVSHGDVQHCDRFG